MTFTLINKDILFLMGLAFIVINIWTFLLFGYDKHLAETRNWRISEHMLLIFAIVGGTLGAYSGRATFRHKTRKQPFSSQLHSIAIFQSFSLAAGTGWFFG